MATQPESGHMEVRHGAVVWTMHPDAARELADFFEEVTSSDDLARKDSRALREWADRADPPDRDDE